MSTHLNDSARKISSTNLNRHIGLYSLAAAVAGVSMLALAEPAAGEVIVTKKTIPIPVAPINMQKPVNLSMANNGVNNFRFFLNEGTSSVGLRELDAQGIGEGAGNQFLEAGDFYGKVLALNRGVTIGPAGITSASFFSSALVEGTNSNNGVFYSRGYWGGNPQNKYMGVRFKLNGQTHYGWIRLTVTSNVKSGKASLEAKITAYAYETVANKPIKAGASATAAADARISEAIHGPSLGMLAAGADALPMWRREETAR